MRCADVKVVGNVPRRVIFATNLVRSMQMFLCLLAACLVVSKTEADRPESPVTEVTAREGRLDIRGKDFMATAHRLTISPDGKRLYLSGSGENPVRLVYRPKGQNAEHRWTGQRIAFSPADGSVQIEGAGRGQRE
jgi:hypothetical protein